MATVVYPVCRTVDDTGAILTGCTVTIASVVDLDGNAVASHGATVHLAGSLVSVAYDAAAKGDAWVTLSVSKSGSTITNENASPAIFATADPSRLGSLPTSWPANIGSLAVDSSGRVVLAPAGLDAIEAEDGLNLRQSVSLILAASVGKVSGASNAASQTIVIRAADDPSTTRITAACDRYGNRSTVTLAAPA